jgi:alpha-glucosidase (family GH31 glycosyl hydrolase)
MQLGAFNPFFRNHNSIYNADQDPGVYSSDVVTSIRKVVETRYTLLPYLYTLFYDVHVKGGTVVRSLVHEFSKDKNTHEIDEQFLWGSALLISPVIEQGILKFIKNVKKFCILNIQFKARLK